MTVEKSSASADGIGTEETRKIVDTITRGGLVKAERIVQQLEREIRRMSDTRLVDFKHCLEEWKIKFPGFLKHFKKHEAGFFGLQILIAQGFHPIIGEALSMLVAYNMLLIRQRRSERTSDALQAVDEEIQRRLHKRKRKKDT